MKLEFQVGEGRPGVSPVKVALDVAPEELEMSGVRTLIEARLRKGTVTRIGKLRIPIEGTDQFVDRRLVGPIRAKAPTLAALVEAVKEDEELLRRSNER